MRASSLGRTQETTVKTFVAKLATVAVAVSLLVVPAPPAVAAHVPDVPAAVVYTPTDARAAERAARTLNRRVAPVAQAVAQPATPVVQKPTKPVVKKPAVKPAKPVVKKVAPKLEVAAVPASGRAAAIVAYARSIVGRPYVFGAAGPSGFDCSGVVVAAARRVGISLPHKASAFYGVGRAVSRSQLQPGDILIMNGGGHAGIYVGNGLMVHAPHPGAHVEVAPIWSFSAARRIV